MLPIAYFSFFLLMNSRSVLGDAMPSGGRRIFYNLIMLLATLVAGFASAWGLYNKSIGWFPLGKAALGALIVLLIVGLISFISKENAAKRTA